jgi:DNA-binding NtrC family response regulator
MKGTVLIVDDEEQMRELLAVLLEAEGYTVHGVGNAAELRPLLDQDQPDLVLLDLRLPDADGLELLPDVKRRWPDTEVIVLTGHASIDAAVSAIRGGAYDFLEKPFDPKALTLILARAMERKVLKKETTFLRKALSTMSGGNAPIFQSASSKQALRTIEKVAPSDATILIVGESGVGKEIVADLVHAMSPRSKGPLIKINCAALPRELIEAELFGSVKGAFTGATSDREGLFRRAAGGTLFLDEISEMPVDTQSKLLRVLQDKEVRPVGGHQSYKIDCRVISATNRVVEQAIAEGKLREDLYYRLGAVTIDVAPLRDRREDILPLARMFLNRYAAQAGQPITEFSHEAESVLVNAPWPGNVRQLQNVVQRAVLLCEGHTVGAGDLSIRDQSPGAARPDLTVMEDLERNAIVQALKETGGNKLQAAKRLGIGRQTLYNKMKLYQIEE